MSFVDFPNPECGWSRMLIIAFFITFSEQRTNRHIDMGRTAQLNLTGVWMSSSILKHGGLQVLKLEA